MVSTRCGLWKKEDQRRAKWRLGCGSVEAMVCYMSLALVELILEASLLRGPPLLI
jgi:hypothetical protein